MKHLGAAAAILVLCAVPETASAQGRGGRPNPPQPLPGAPFAGPGAPSSPISTSQFRQFGVWLDDATTRARGQGSVGFGAGYWRGASGSLLDMPILDGSYAVTDRLQLGASVPFYRAESGGATSRGIDDVYLSGKLVVLDPAVPDARFGIAVTPVLEILSPGFYDDRVHWALPVSAEFRVLPFRVYGSTGYFSRGAYFGAGAVEWNSPQGTALTFAVTHSAPTSEDISGLTGGRSDFSVSVAQSVTDAVAVYVSAGRTLASPDDSSKTTFGLSGGVSFSFAASRP